MSTEGSSPMRRPKQLPSSVPSPICCSGLGPVHLVGQEYRLTLDAAIWCHPSRSDFRFSDVVAVRLRFFCVNKPLSAAWRVELTEQKVSFAKTADVALQQHAVGGVTRMQNVEHGVIEMQKVE